MIHVQTWPGSGSARVTDMTNAGKRGRTCRVLRFSGNGRYFQDDATTRATHETLTWLESLPENVSWESVARVVEAMVARAAAPGYVDAYREEVRSVDAPVKVLTAGVAGQWSATADNDGVHMADLVDANEWREITPGHRQKRSQAYRLASKVWTWVERCRTLSEARDVLRQAGCLLHGYCGMD